MLKIAISVTLQVVFTLSYRRYVERMWQRIFFNSSLQNYNVNFIQHGENYFDIWIPRDWLQTTYTLRHSVIPWSKIENSATFFLFELNSSEKNASWMFLIFESNACTNVLWVEYNVARRCLITQCNIIYRGAWKYYHIVNKVSFEGSLR